MKKSFHSTLILVAVLVGLSVWYLVYEQKLKGQWKEKEESQKVLLTTPSESVQEILVEQRQGEGKKATYRTIAFKKVGNEWTLTQPVEDAAEVGAVSGLLNLATQAKQDRVIEEKPASLEPFGLDFPKLKISVKKDAKAEPEVLLVGSDTPVGSSVYVKTGKNDAVFRGPISLRTSFEKAPADYRNKKILHLAKPEINEIEIRGPGEPVLLKRAEERWTLSRQGWPAGEPKVNEVLNGVLDLRAVGFAAEKGADLGKFGLSPAAYTVILKKPGAQTLIQFGKVKDKYYAKRGDKPFVYEIGKEAYEKLMQPSSAYQEKRLAMFNRFDVRRIQIEHGPQSFEMVKEAENWKLGSDLAVKLDKDKVEEYLTRLQDAQIQGFLPASDKPKTAELVVRLFEGVPGASKPEEKLTLKIGKPQGGRAAGERNGLGVAFGISEAEFKKINAFKQEFVQNGKS